MSGTLLDFYEDRGPDHRGRMRTEILGWPDSRLEAVHDYIQWLFPLTEPSAFNPDAPVLTPQDIQAFRASPELQDRLRAALRIMLRFYGFSDGERTNWLTPGNHNHLGVTRILKRVRDAVAPATFHYWSEAVKPSEQLPRR